MTPRSRTCQRPLWVSAVPHYGVIRAVIVDGAFAARFDDLDGEGSADRPIT